MGYPNDLLTFPIRFNAISYALQWRHNKCDGASNHRRLDCFLNCLLRRRSKKTSKLRVTVHKGPGTQKMFPFHDVIVALLHLAHSTKNMRLISLTALEALFLLSESCAYESMSSTKYSVSYTMKRSKTCDIWEHTFSRNGNESNFSRITSSKTDWPKLNSAS